MKQNNKLLAIITILYFFLPFIHMSLALTAILCMGLPFALTYSTGRKIWCSSYCPRSYWMDFSGLLGKNRKAPKKLISPKARRIVLIYFCVNFLFITMSSIMVGLGRVEPMDVIRFFILIPTDWRLPQLLNLGTMPPVLLHLSYRFYSVMLSSTIAGTLMAIFYKPRTWCAVCPINTLTSGMTKS